MNLSTTCAFKARKLFTLLALLSASTLAWADTEKFVAANATIDHTYFRTNGWADETTASTCNWVNGELTLTMTESKNEQWQAQVFLDTKITYDASKQYDISFDIITNNGVGGIMVKLGDAGSLYYETITTGAGVSQHYSKANVQGVAANDGMLIFDFGYAPANTNVTISNISIVEKEPVITQYCQKATGHLGQANFGDVNGRILLTLTKLSDSSVGVKVEPNNGGADVFDFVEVILGGVSKTLGSVGGSVPTTSEIVYEGLASLNFNINILWHNKKWADNGRWTTNQFAVTEAELCSAPIESEYCGYQGSETQQDGHYYAITWETDASGNVVISIGNGTGAGACSFRNGGFEGGNNGLDNFVVSDDNFATTTPASDYFTVTRPTDGDLQYVLTKKADLPENAKIKHLSAGAIAWREAGVDRWCFPEFIYTYGAICTEEPELTSLLLSASASIAQVGNSVTLTASPLDQFGAPIEATVSYSINPTDAGSVTNNVFTFAKTGAVTITASAGALEESITLYGVSSDNIALNKTCEAGYWDNNDGEKAIAANDGNESSAWVTWSWQDAAVEWWYVDLGNSYDITAINVLWGADYSTNYILQVRADAPSAENKANDEAWTTIATVTNASANKLAMNYVTATGRYLRLHSLSKSGACIRLRELQVFGSESASLTKQVSASVNDANMGVATVKQNNIAVTEVATGSEVTFSAVANEGYIFVNWSNGETRSTFTTAVNATMNLTANFRALGNIYCVSEISKDGHTAYVTMRRSAENTYQLIVRSEEELENFGGVVMYKPENVLVQDLRNLGVLTNNNHTLTATITADRDIYMGTPLYVVIRGAGEIHFDQLTNIEYGAECDDNVPVTSVSVNSTAAVAIGATTTLAATIAPVYATNQTVTWSSDNTAVATVSSEGVVTGVAAGTAHITATTVDGGRTAQCTITVTEAQIYWGNGRNNDIAIAYSIEYNIDKTLTYTIDVLQSKDGFVLRINDGNWRDPERVGDVYVYTSENTYEVGTVINGVFLMPYAGGEASVNFSYTVGETSERQAYIPVEFDQDATDATWIEANNGQTRDVEVERTLEANSYYKTICFPFAMTAEQIENTFGTCEILMLSGGRMKSATDIYLQYVPVREIVAGKPYLMTIANTVTGLDFNGVTINSSTANNEITADLGDGKQIKMLGTFTKQSLTASGLYYLDIDGYLHSVSDYGAENGGAAVTIPAFRCYYQFVGFGGNQAPVRVRVVRATDVETGFEDAVSETTITKQLRDGQLFIIRDGKRYTVTGLQVK